MTAETDLEAAEPAAPPQPPPQACDRCGTFAELAARGRRLVCAECIRRAPVDLEASWPTVGTLLVGTGQVARHLFGRALAASVVIQLPMVVAEIFTDELPVVVPIAYAVVAVIAEAAVIRMTVALADGERPDVGAALLASLKRWPSLLVCTVIVLVATVLGAMVCLVPGIYVAVTFALGTGIVALETRNPFSALRESAARMDGFRWPYFGALLAVQIPVTILSLGLEFLVAALAEILALEGELAATAIDALVGGLDVALALAVYPLLAVPGMLLAAVLYVKLRDADRSAHGVR